MNNDTGDNKMEAGNVEQPDQPLHWQEERGPMEQSPATGAHPGKKAKVRQWRVGTFSMGITLIVLGILLIVGRIYGLPVLPYIMKLWPLIIIVLGLEMVVYNGLANRRGGAVRIVYDFFSNLPDAAYADVFCRALFFRGNGNFGDGRAVFTDRNAFC